MSKDMCRHGIDIAVACHECDGWAKNKQRALEQAPVFRKDDTDKLDWNLMPWLASAKTVQVLMFGAKKYGADNWRNCESPRRYYAAAMRHLIARMRGEVHDPESKLPHLAHAACCILFALELEEEKAE